MAGPLNMPIQPGSVSMLTIMWGTRAYPTNTPGSVLIRGMPEQPEHLPQPPHTNPRELQQVLYQMPVRGQRRCLTLRTPPHLHRTYLWTPMMFRTAAALMEKHPRTMLDDWKVGQARIWKQVNVNSESRRDIILHHNTRRQLAMWRRDIRTVLALLPPTWTIWQALGAACSVVPTPPLGQMICRRLGLHPTMLTLYLPTLTALVKEAKMARAIISGRVEYVLSPMPWGHIQRVSPSETSPKPLTCVTSR